MLKNHNKKIVTIAVVAHVDHGKSTFSDRVIELCLGTKLNESCVLDSMDLEKERKVSIKLHPVRLTLNTFNYTNVILNLIDTPGHVDFSHEVSISLEICDIVFLLIDITQGIQAQTLSHAQKAIQLNKKLILIFNKIDLAEKFSHNITNAMHLLKLHKNTKFYFVSAKTGEGIKELLYEEVDNFIENSKQEIIDINSLNTTSNEFSCKIIDSWFNKFLGIVSAVKILKSKIKTNEIAYISNHKLKLHKIGFIYLKKTLEDSDELNQGEVGFVCSKVVDNIQNSIKLFKPGNIISSINNVDNKNEYKTSSCYYNIFPKVGSNLDILKKSLLEIQLNDYGVEVEGISSKFFGHGFKCGFLGTFHAEIFFERVKKISGEIFFISRPEVSYKIVNTNKIVTAPSEINVSDLKNVQIPYTNATIIVPSEMYGEIIKMLQNDISHYILSNQMFEDNFAILKVQVPFKEILNGLQCKIKSITSGFGSLAYENITFRHADIIKIDFAVNDEIIQPLSLIDFFKTHKTIANEICNKLQENISRHQFKIVINCLINNRKIMRREIKPFRKDVTAKCYGGDVTRKNKLLKKQKAGKKKLFERSGKNFIDKSQIINLSKIDFV